MILTSMIRVITFIMAFLLLSNICMATKATEEILNIWPIDRYGPRTPRLAVVEITAINYNNGQLLISGETGGYPIYITPGSMASESYKKKAVKIKVGEKYLMTLKDPRKEAFGLLFKGLSKEDRSYKEIQEMEWLDARDWPGSPYIATNLADLYLLPITRDSFSGLATYIK